MAGDDPIHGAWPDECCGGVDADAAHLVELDLVGMPAERAAVVACYKSCAKAATAVLNRHLDAVYGIAEARLRLRSLSGAQVRALFGA